MPTPFRPIRTLVPRLALLAVAVAVAVSAVAAVGAGGGTALGATASSAPPRPALRVAGTGTVCATAPACGDGSPAVTAALTYPQGVAVDGAGDLYVADWGNNTVRRITPDGRISTVAGNGVACQVAPACGDGGPATAAELSFPTAVALDRRGNLYIADSGNDEIRMVTPAGTIDRIAGTGVSCTATAPCGDNGPARAAQLASPDGVAVDAAGNVVIADTGDNRIREITAAGRMTTLAGDGTQCMTAPRCGDGGPAAAAQLNFPEGVAVGAGGRILLADDGDNEVRQILAGRITRIAGTGTACAAAPACGDGGAATAAALSSPQSVAVDGAGNVVIADWGNSEVRVVSPRGTIGRLAGTGTACAAPPACADGGPATSAQLSSAHGVASDAAGNVWIADTFDAAVRLVPGLSGGRSGAAAPALAILGTGAGSRRGSLVVRFATSEPAPVTLTLTPRRGRPVTAARGSAGAGLGELTWDGHLGRAAAPRGRYTLTLSLSGRRGGASASVNVTR